MGVQSKNSTLAEPLLEPPIWGGHPNLPCRPHSCWSNNPAPSCWCDHYLPTPYRRSFAHLPPAPISTTALPPSTPDLHRWVDSLVRNSDMASSPPRGRCPDASRAFISFASWPPCGGCEEERFDPNDVWIPHVTVCQFRFGGIHLGVLLE
jgi:hypothetical protein